MEKNQKEIRSPRGEAKQLLRIARMEFNRPLQTASALVWGRGAPAAALLALLREEGGAATGAHAQKAPPEGTRFDLAVLLEPIAADRLDEWMEPGSLVLDAAAQTSGEWAVFDAAGGYRRIRVLSLMR